MFGGDTCIGLEDIARKREGVEIPPPPTPVGRRLNTMEPGDYIYTTLHSLPI